jgi:UDP-N-acetylglucosamine 2-epimerase (non-hydrolysing)
MTILGTRPEIIRLSRLIEILDDHSEHVLVNTGQNYDDRLSGLFFRELQVRPPDISLGVGASGFADQIGKIFSGTESALQQHRPDRLLILGDTNSGLSTIIARRMGIPVYHMEAGNRCFDFRVPEENNRLIIDHLSSVLMPYTNRSRQNLLHEGFASSTICVTGNPIFEVLRHFEDRVVASSTLLQLNVEKNKFFLVTMHRAENVDVECRVRGVLEAIGLLYEKYRLPVVCSVHPHTQSTAARFGIALDQAGCLFCEPFGFFDFVKLERSAFCVLTDSGTVQEETCILRVPNVTIRDVTERPETLDCGSNRLAGCDPKTIVEAVESVTSKPPDWKVPQEYLVPDVAHRVARILLNPS